MDNEYLNGYAKIFGAVGTAVYVSLCRHADSETQKCYPSIKLISEELNISRPTVIKYLKAFEEYHIIEKVGGKRNNKQQWINNEYILLDKTEWKRKPSQVKPFNTAKPSKTIFKAKSNHFQSQVKPFNTKDTHINNTNINNTQSLQRKALRKLSPEEKEHKKKIDALIDLFSEVNPTHARLFGNKTERQAMERLFKKFGEDWLAKLLKALPKIISQPYAPRITTPYQLEKKMGELKAFVEQARKKQNSKGKQILYAIPNNPQ